MVQQINSKHMEGNKEYKTKCNFYSLILYITILLHLLRQSKPTDFFKKCIYIL